MITTTVEQAMDQLGVLVPAPTAEFAGIGAMSRAVVTIDRFFQDYGIEISVKNIERLAIALMERRLYNWYPESSTSPELEYVSFRSPRDPKGRFAIVYEHDEVCERLTSSLNNAIHQAVQDIW